MLQFVALVTSHELPKLSEAVAEKFMVEPAVAIGLLGEMVIP